MEYLLLLQPGQRSWCHNTYLLFIFQPCWSYEERDTLQSTSFQVYNTSATFIMNFRLTKQLTRQNTLIAQIHCCLIPINHRKPVFLVLQLQSCDTGKKTQIHLGQNIFPSPYSIISISHRYKNLISLVSKINLYI